MGEIARGPNFSQTWCQSNIRRERCSVLILLNLCNLLPAVASPAAMPFGVTLKKSGSSVTDDSLENKKAEPKEEANPYAINLKKTPRSPTDEDAKKPETPLSGDAKIKAALAAATPSKPPPVDVSDDAPKSPGGFTLQLPTPTRSGAGIRCPRCKIGKADNNGLCPECTGSIVFPDTVGTLGIAFQEYSKGQAERLWPVGYTVYISHVEPGMAGEQAGLFVGLSICAVNGDSTRHKSRYARISMLGTHTTTRFLFPPFTHFY